MLDDLDADLEESWEVSLGSLWKNSTDLKVTSSLGLSCYLIENNFIQVLGGLSSTGCSDMNILTWKINIFSILGAINILSVEDTLLEFNQEQDSETLKQGGINGQAETSRMSHYNWSSNSLVNSRRSMRSRSRHLDLTKNNVVALSIHYLPVTKCFLVHF